jgi:hypothetical protein
MAMDVINFIEGKTTWLHLLRSARLPQANPGRSMSKEMLSYG